MSRLRGDAQWAILSTVETPQLQRFRAMHALAAGELLGDEGVANEIFSDTIRPSSRSISASQVGMSRLSSVPVSGSHIMEHSDGDPQDHGPPFGFGMQAKLVIKSFKDRLDSINKESLPEHLPSANAQLVLLRNSCTSCLRSLTNAIKQAVLVMRNAERKTISESAESIEGLTHLVNIVDDVLSAVPPTCLDMVPDAKDHSDPRVVNAAKLFLRKVDAQASPAFNDAPCLESAVTLLQGALRAIQELGGR